MIRRSTAVLLSAITGLALFSTPAFGADNPAEPSEPGLLQITEISPPKISGTLRYGKTIKRTIGKYDVPGIEHKTQWFRDDKPIPKATQSKYKLTHNDVGKRISVQTTVTKSGYESLVSTSSQTAVVKHARDVRKTVKYVVTTRGSVKSDKSVFNKRVNEILNDPRGWRRAGIAFQEVDSGGTMTVVLAAPNKMRSFSSACSPTWSCRVGRYVVINDDRWRLSTKTWKKAKDQTLDTYRHMVVNHETGHWLGWYHKSCKGKGKKAPVMMQQSKGLAGCKANPWPTKAELKTPRFK